jgi:hypothetical protein
MSNPKNAINEIKNLMVKFGFMSEEHVMASFKLSDNTILQTSKLEVGNEIVKINEQFEQVKLEDGSYRLVENFNIDVKDGKIVTVKEIFIDATLVDGTVVKVEGDSLIEGAKVVVVTPDAEIPAPDGVHELADGTKIETKDGLITMVMEVMEDVEEGEVPEIPSVEVPAVVISDEVMSMLKEFISKMGEKMSQMEQSYSSLQNEFNKFKSEPAGKKIRDGKTEQFNKEGLDPMDAKLAAINGLRFSNKK